MAALPLSRYIHLTGARSVVDLELDPGGLYATGLLTAALVSVVSLSLGARYLHAQLRVNPAVLLRSG